MNSNLNTLSTTNCDQNRISKDARQSLFFTLNSKGDLKPLLNSNTLRSNNLQNDQASLLYNFKIKLSQNKNLQNFISGLTGGLLATTVLHPLDVLKIRLAVNDGRSSTKRAYQGLINASKTIWAEEGVRGYYRGLTPNSLGAGLSWGLYFLFYNSIRNSQIDNSKEKDLIFLQSMIAAGEAGTLTLLLTNPIWVIKTRLCLQYGSNLSSLTSKLPPEKQYSNMTDAFRKTYRSEGIKGLYSGFFPGLLNVTHGAIQFSIYEKLKNWHKNEKKLNSDSQISLLYIFYFSVISKVCAATVTYPLQVIRARLQDQHGNYAGFRDAVVTTYRREKIAGYYKGFIPNAIRYVPASCITLMTYEFMGKFSKVN